jgi:hypothetical protein
MWVASRGDGWLTHGKRIMVSLLAVAVTLSAGGQSLSGERFTTSIYEGPPKSIKIDKYGLQPGLCEGAIILASQGGEDTPVDVRVGTWIKRGDNFLTVEDWQIGDRVKAQTFRFPGEAKPARGDSGIYESVR